MRTLVTSAPATVTSATAYSASGPLIALALHLKRVVARRESGHRERAVRSYLTGGGCESAELQTAAQARR